MAGSSRNDIDSMAETAVLAPIEYLMLMED